MELIKVEKIDEELFTEMVRRILEIIDPIKIILFGSYASGKSGEESDVDILVIVEDIETTRRELRLKIRKALRPFLIPKDIVVTTPKDVEEWKDVPQAFITSIIRKGKVIYER